MKLLNYPGSKWGLAEEIAAMLPPHRTYLEPYFGSGAVFFTKAPSPIEIINDLDGDVVNLFRTIRWTPELLAERIELTPYSRAVFDDAWEDRGHDPVDEAARFLIRSKMGFGYKCHTKTGFKIDLVGREAGYAVREWNSVPEGIRAVAGRLKDACIENRPALELIRKCNDSKAAIYCDPPYLMDTRGGRQYNHEMTKQDHEELLHELLRSRAAVILSGYPSELYDDALKGWYRMERDSRNQNRERRTEALWCNFEPAGAEQMRMEDVLMSENKVPLVLTEAELVKALRCCVTNSNQGGGCRNCPMQKWSGKAECDELTCLMAADRIEELMEENGQLRDATENLCQQHRTEMVRLAGEMNTALDRGLQGANEELFRQMHKHQEELVELGRKSVIHVDPAGEKGWRVLGVEIEGVKVYGTETAGA